MKSAAIHEDPLSALNELLLLSFFITIHCCWTHPVLFLFFLDQTHLPIGIQQIDVGLLGGVDLGVFAVEYVVVVGRGGLLHRVRDGNNDDIIKPR